MEKTRRNAHRPLPLDRDAWIRGALIALADEGPAGLRVEALAKRLKVTKGSFYWHFKDRRDLMDSVLDQWKNGRIRDIRKQTTAQPGQELAALHHAIAVYAAGRNRRGLPIELALREWARRDVRAAQVVEEVDAERLNSATRLFQALGLPQAEAAARSVLLYAYVFGFSLMRCGGYPAEMPQVKDWIAELIAGGPAKA